MTTTTTPTPEVGRYDDFAITLGRTGLHLSKDVDWLPAREAHTLVAGAAGSGKTVFVQHVLRQVEAGEWGTCLADLRPPISDTAAADRVGRSAEDYLQLVEDAHALMTSRYRDLFDGDLVPHRPLLLALEEPGTVLDAAGEQLLDALLRCGRGARIHVLISAQNPSSRLLIGSVASSIAHRVGLGQLSPLSARLLFGDHQRLLQLEDDTPGIGFIAGADRAPTLIAIPGPAQSLR